MFDYLQQFNNLPSDLRNQVSSSSAMAILMELENKYKVDLAMTVMKIMIRSLAVKDLPNYFVSEFNLIPDQAEKLSQEIKERLLFPVADYLGLSREKQALDLDKDINILIKEAGLVLPSEALINRFKSILATYLKGVRSKIDARAALAKNIENGGLNLGQPEIERVFKVCDGQKFKSVDINLYPAPTPPSTRLDKIIDKADKTKAVVAEYDLKQALAQGQVKKPIQLDASHELASPEPELDLPAPQKIPNLPLAKLASLQPVKPTSPAPSSPSVATPPIVKPRPVIPPVSSPVPPIAQIKKPEKKAGLWNKLFKAEPAPAAKSATIKPITPVPVKPPVGPLSVSPPKPTPIVRPVMTSGKPQVQDIKPMPKVMGPIEELQFLDLVNFRRLGKTPAEITAKIFSKIKLLEREGYDKMILGVKAWRQSPVNRLYLKIGQDSLTKGVPLKEMVEAKQKEDQSSLNLAEIEAIVSLNSKLVF